MTQLLVDGPWVAHRSYLIPVYRRLTNSKGEDTTMIYAFFKSLNKIVREHKPDDIIITWESHPTPSWRKKILPTYKPSKPMKPAYFYQLNTIQNLLYNNGVPQFFSPTNEADDCIAALIKNKPTKIYTIDKDIMQLIDDDIPVEVITGKKTYREADVVEKFDIIPKQIPLYLALVGDTSDNIPGIPKIGAKKAVKIIESFEDNILTEEQLALAYVYKQLTTLNHNAKCLPLIPEIINTTSYILNKYELKDININFGKTKPIKKLW